jgi:hypothetical protein
MKFYFKSPIIEASLETNNTHETVLVGVATVGAIAVWALIAHLLPRPDILRLAEERR